MTSKKQLGAKLQLSRRLRDDELLFGECQSVIIITIEEQNLLKLVQKAKELGVYTQTIGKVIEESKFLIK